MAEQIRRRDKRVWFVVLGVFLAVFLFTFLTQKFKDNEDVDAANLANFDPGYIISDYQMGNYNSMSEADIQRFLTAKNPCNNTDYNLYVNLTNRYPGYSWRWANGHFVCISEERFGDGETIGSGETAAHIIWRAAQDYRINPQVLIVLLQKEQGLITDNYPNSRQYRAATGYGCPDTAACSSQYYGFKNQVRKAAALFRAVLDGGWTNYPLGNNYIQYNPNAACGGSVVNVRSLATSALYRYTPYQPNGSALAAGYGTGDGCGAYGNRNFYLYFEDWFGGATNTQKSARVPDGVYYIQTAAANTVIGVANNSSASGANIQLSAVNQTDMQKWKLTYNLNTDDYSIVNLSSGMVIDVEAASVKDGANVRLWDSNKSCAQRWKIIETNKDEVKIISSCSGKALDVVSGAITNGVNIQIWEDNGTNAQKWKLMPSEIVPDGVYVISSSLILDKTVDIQGGSYNAKDGTNVQLWESNNTAAQRWKIERGKDGYYMIKNLQSGKSIDVAAAGRGNGANIQVWDNNDTCAQKWRILKASENYSFISACSGKVIDLGGANTKNGTNIQLYEANNSGAQKWRLVPAEKIQNDEYIIVSKLSENMAIDISGNSSSNGANVQLYEVNGTSAQLWYIKYDEKTDTYTIHNNGAGKALDVVAAGRSAGVNIQTWENNGTCAQKWSIVKVGDVYEIYSACSGLALDVEAAQTKNSTNIQLYTVNGTNAQKWLLRRP